MAHANKPCVILNDQEPFDFYHAVDSHVQKTQHLRVPGLHPDLSLEDVFRLYWVTTTHPIFCHSEHNSDDIDLVRSLGFIPCHYFWHGLVSRDWFRHWKNHPTLTTTNRLVHSKERFLLYALGLDGTRAYRKTVLEKLQPLDTKIRKNQNPLIDTSWSAKIDTDDARSDLIHVVAETLFSTSKIHLTEKIFKPMVMRQPFILFGAAGSLAYLRRYGFKTFADIWDESYDDELDHDKRLHLIIDLINQLADMPQLQFNQLFSRCRQIVEHNARHFFSDAFEDIMLEELHTNMRASLAEQARLMTSDPGGLFFETFDRLRREDQAVSQNHVIRLRQFAGLCHQYQPEKYHAIHTQYPWISEYLV